MVFLWYSWGLWTKHHWGSHPGYLATVGWCGDLVTAPKTYISGSSVDGDFTYIHIYIYGYGSIPTNTILMGWTSIYQLFWCSPGVQGFDTLPYIYILWLIISPWISREYPICVHNSSINLGKFDHDRTLSSRTLESWFILGKSSPNGQTLQVLVKYHNLPRYISLYYIISCHYLLYFFDGHFRNLNWRYLPYMFGLFFRPKFQGISPENMAQNMVRLRTSINWILKISHWSWDDNKQWFFMGSNGISLGYFPRSTTFPGEKSAPDALRQVATPPSQARGSSDGRYGSDGWREL